MCILFCLPLMLACVWRQSYGGIYDKTVRLHVLADSDLPQAQELKLKVRDGLLSLLEGELSCCESREQAQERITALLPDLQAQAERTLLENGSTLPVSLSLTKEQYPLRVYEGCTYPAGAYLSLRVFIGRGEGRNWWCVVYPPLCLSSSLAEDSVYSKEEQALLTGKTEGYRLKLAFLEVGDRLWRLFKK